MAEQFPPLSAATLAAANQVGAWLAQDDLATLPALPQVDDGGAGRQRRDPDHRRRLPAGGGTGSPAADQRRRGTFYELSLRGGAPGSRYRMLPVVGRPEAHILADIAHDYWHISALAAGGGGPIDQLRRERPFYPGHAGERGSLIVAGSSFRTPPCSGEPWPPSPASGRERRRRHNG